MLKLQIVYIAPMVLEELLELLTVQIHQPNTLLGVESGGVGSPVTISIDCDGRLVAATRKPGTDSTQNQRRRFAPPADAKGRGDCEGSHAAESGLLREAAQGAARRPAPRPVPGANFCPCQF